MFVVVEKVRIELVGTEELLDLTRVTRSNTHIPDKFFAGISYFDDPQLSENNDTVYQWLYPVRKSLGYQYAEMLISDLIAQGFSFDDNDSASAWSDYYEAHHNQDK